MNESEINEKISAYFEQKPTITIRYVDLQYATEHGQCIKDGFSFYSPKRLWRGGDKEWIPAFEFFHSEDASSRLLEAMPEPQLWIESNKGEPKLWGCSADLQDEHSGYFTAFDADRKAAIAMAFVAWAKIEVKP